MNFQTNDTGPGVGDGNGVFVDSAWVGVEAGVDVADAETAVGGTGVGALGAGAEAAQPATTNGIASKIANVKMRRMICIASSFLVARLIRRDGGSTKRSI